MDERERNALPHHDWFTLICVDISAMSHSDNGDD
jgi:hypothetical protein